MPPQTQVTLTAKSVAFPKHTSLLTMTTPQGIRDYLAQTVTKGGSDLHLTVGAPPAARVHGSLQALEEMSFDASQVRELILGTMNETQRSKLEDDWELDYAIEVSGVGRFRGNVHFCRQNIEAVYRYIPAEIPELSTLGHYPILEEICHLQRGLVLITGVTGSGKTTTLASLVQRISEIRSGTIITLEDPIEFSFQHNSSLIKQREIGRDTKSFSLGLRQCMRQDPDVIVVGELRDRESMQIAMTAAETGHLVISTLHTIDAPKSVERIMDLFPSDQQVQIASQLSNVLEAIICQRLLPRADTDGRVLATEALRVNSGIQSSLRKRKIEQVVGLMEIARQEGCHTIDDCLETLVAHNYITQQDAIQNCRDPHRFTSESLASRQAVKK
jgi:twitching motility protein PilT